MTDHASIRDAIRLEEGGSTDPAIAGGQCGLVCAEIDPDHMENGIVILTDGLHVPDHYWLVYGETIIDPTADQFGGNLPVAYHPWCACSMCEATPTDRPPFRVTA